MAVDAAVGRVVGHADFAATFKHPVKFNGTDFVETRLSAEEQHAEVRKLATKSLHVFLERYGRLLPAEDIRALGTDPLAATAEARFWVERLLRAPPTSAERQKKSRRRRWVWARREMARPDGFFSEDEMKRRDPQLFHQIVGRHLDSSVRASAPMQGNLSNYLLWKLDSDCESGRLAAGPCDPEPGAEGGQGGDGRGEAMSTDGAEREEAEDVDVEPPSPASDDEAPGAGASGGAAPDDIAAKRARFLKVMRDRFVNGQESRFKYSSLDDDSELDDVVELGRDAEDQYFGDE